MTNARIPQAAVRVRLSRTRRGSQVSTVVIVPARHSAPATAAPAKKPPSSRKVAAMVTALSPVGVHQSVSTAGCVSPRQVQLGDRLAAASSRTRRRRRTRTRRARAGSGPGPPAGASPGASRPATGSSCRPPRARGFAAPSPTRTRARRSPRGRGPRGCVRRVAARRPSGPCSPSVRLIRAASEPRDRDTEVAV